MTKSGAKWGNVNFGWDKAPNYRITNFPITHQETNAPKRDYMPMNYS